MEFEWTVHASEGGSGTPSGGKLPGALSNWLPLLVLPAGMVMAAQELRSLSAACSEEPW